MTTEGSTMTETKPIDPTEFAKRTPLTGTPVRILDEIWVLSDGIVGCPATWDRIYDDNVMRGQYDHDKIVRAAMELLLANYAIDFDVAITLLRAANIRDLVKAVELALFGPPKPWNTYTEWVRSALLANGMEPSQFSPDDLRLVLIQLVGTGRAIPLDKFLSSSAYMKKREGLTGKVQR